MKLIKEFKKKLNDDCQICAVFWWSMGEAEIATQGKMYFRRCAPEDCIIQAIKEIRANGYVEREFINESI